MPSHVVDKVLAPALPSGRRDHIGPEACGSPAAEKSLARYRPGISQSRDGFRKQRTRPGVGFLFAVYFQPEAALVIPEEGGSSG